MLTATKTVFFASLVLLATAALAQILYIPVSDMVRAAISACPKKMEFEVDADNVDLDVGFTGLGHDFKLSRNTVVTFLTHTCEGNYPNCGVCKIGDVVPNGRGCAQYRCTNNTGIECNADTDCFQMCLGGDNDGLACTVDSDCNAVEPSATCEPAGSCKYFLGAPLPLSAGSQPTCVTNQLMDRLGGTINVNTGDAKMIFKSVSKIYNGLLVDQPCPICVGDTTPFDGVKDGTCSAGEGGRPGKPCDACADYLYPAFGASSLDCPPLAGAKIGDFEIDLTSVTSTVTATVSTSSPKCKAPGYKSYYCPCNTCANVASIPCASDSDCPVCDSQNCVQGECGKKRCQGGADAGKRCTQHSECSSGVCTIPGEATKPNTCSGGVTDCAPNPSDTDSCDEGECQSGPYDMLCVIERFRGCGANSDCTAPGDTCGTFPRQCFTVDGSTTGDTDIQRCGAPSLPVNGVSTPRLANITCDSYTQSSAINSVIGLPGPQTLEMPGTLRVLE